MNIIICGLPACGKTTTGKLLAELLHWNFIDTDALIEGVYAQRTGQEWSCRQICRIEGEKYFRTLEKEVIASLGMLQKTVISIGGGSLVDPDNLEILKNLGLLLYLKMDPELIWGRLCLKGIPAYIDSKSSFDLHVQKRVPLYEQHASAWVDVQEMTPKQIVSTILNYGMVTYGK